MSPASRIHPTAIIDRTARVAEGAIVGPWCVIGAEAEIGDGTELRSHVVVGPWTKLGRENVVHPFAVVGGDPQDKKFQGEQTWLEIGDRNQIREHVSIHRGTGNGGGQTRIGNDNLIMAVAHVAHDCVIGHGTVIANNVMLAGHVHVHDFATIGGAAGVHHLATIGTCSMVGGMARCSMDVPPFMIVEGSNEVRGHNHIALSRHGYGEEEIEALKEAYKRLFRNKGGNTQEKIESLLQAFPSSPSIRHLCDSVAATARGKHGRALESRRADDKRAPRPGAAGADPHPGDSGADPRPGAASEARPAASA